MLDRLDAAEAQLVGARRDPQALVVVVGGAAIFRPERGKEIESESHGRRGLWAMGPSRRKWEASSSVAM
jgi:hypothetical protein